MTNTTESLPALEGVINLDLNSGNVLDPKTQFPFKPLVRGKSHEATASIAEIIEGSSVYRWVTADPDAYQQAVSRDSDVTLALSSVRDLISQLEDPSLDREKRALLSLAVGERLVEIDALSAPYMPKSVKEDIEMGEELQGMSAEDLLDLFKSNKFNMLSRMGSLAGFVLLPFIKNRPTTSNPKPSNRPQKNSNDLSKAESDTRKDQRRKFTQNVAVDNLPIRNPLLDSSATTGQDRRWKSIGGKATVVQMDKDSITKGLSSVFIITKIMNEYDPQSGEMRIASTPQPTSYVAQPERGLYTNIGILDFTSIHSVNIPNVIDDEREARQVRLLMGGDHSLAALEIGNSQSEVLIESEELEPYLRIDSLGNLSLSFESMPEELLRRLEGENLVLHPQYSTRNYSENEIDTHLMGGMPEDELFRLNLYPEDVSKFIKVLLRKKAAGIDGFSTNQDIFYKISQYLGDWLLTYDLEDAIPEDDDPQGFNQTERVFVRQLASCEGANIALSQLMRYFLNEGEGVAFIEGFVVDKSGIGSADDFHLMVMYVDQDRSSHIFDATPWGPESKMEIAENVMGYVQAKKRWIDIAKKSNIHSEVTREELADGANEATKALAEAWPIRVIPDALRSALSEKFGWGIELPGKPQNRSISYFISSGRKEVRKSRWPISRKKMDIDEIRLSAFLKSYFGFDERFDGYFSSPFNPIDGSMFFELSSFERPFYEPNRRAYISVDKYIDKPMKREILRNGHTRDVLYKKMATISIHAQEAAVQNIEAVNNLSSQIAMLQAGYSSEFRTLLGEALGDEVNIDDFWRKVPFEYLLDNPLPLLSDFFMRSRDPKTLGHLTTESGNISVEFMRRTAEWEEAMKKRLEIFRILMKKPPRRIREFPEKVISSTHLWRNLIKPDDEIKRIKKKGVVNPVDIFIYLLEHMHSYELLQASEPSRG